MGKSLQEGKNRPGTLVQITNYTANPANRQHNIPGKLGKNLQQDLIVTGHNGAGGNEDEAIENQIATQRRLAMMDSKATEGTDRVRTYA